MGGVTNRTWVGMEKWEMGKAEYEWTGSIRTITSKFLTWVSIIA